ncbi:hypothetical protein [Iodobacter fluviatilis]|uniref:Molecular chaperone DnaJ n=1 Tax=Iodobacter fluviatilis TaxID=537 RepID=A0A7G3GB02_9NEIS|nr:hypothetical protein [Iodobacter fluviatilis]QBC44426.1 hypothetical protein C1H71_13405 [Iodobacter fluviatilis]
MSNAIELAQYLEAGRPGELELLGYLSDAAKELRRLAAVEAELTALPGQVVPSGYGILPLALTAGNGAKYLLSGEFKEIYEDACECQAFDDEDSDDECEMCGGYGEVQIVRVISWSNIKAIWAMAASNLEIKS